MVNLATVKNLFSKKPNNDNNMALGNKINIFTHTIMYLDIFLFSALVV